MMLLMLMLLMTTTTTMMMIMIYDDDDYICYKKLGQKYKYITWDNKYNAVKFLFEFHFFLREIFLPHYRKILSKRGIL